MGNDGFNASECASSISFRVVDRDIEYHLIQRVATLMKCLPAVASRYYDAIFTAVHKSAETAKKDGVRKPFSRPELERFLEEIRATIDASTLEAPVRGGHIELLLFDVPGTTRPAPDPDYYLGVYADLRHIIAGQDILRPELMQALAVNLERRNFCVLRAPSGSGKTTLMYRFAYEHRHAFRIYRLNHLGNDTATVEQCVRFVRALQPSAEAPVMLLIDNLFRPEKNGWPLLVGRLLEEPAVYVVATTREDEWNPADMRGLNVEYIPLSLSPDTAGSFHQMLKERDQLHPDYPDWHEAYELSKTKGEALFMEYAYLLTQGKHIREVLDEQVTRIEEQGEIASAVRLRSLRYICTAHSYGGRVPANLLSQLVGYTEEEVKRYIRQLIDEHLITEERSFYVGLHEVRSTFLRERTHDLPPPGLAETLATLASRLPLEEVAVITEKACKTNGDIDDSLFEAIARRLDTEGDLNLVSEILHRLRTASEWHYADKVKTHLDEHGIRPNEISVFAVELAQDLPKPIGLVHNEMFAAEHRKAFATVPRRLPAHQFERRLASRLIRSALAGKIDRCSDVGTISYFVNWLHAVDPEAAEEVAQNVSIPHLADLCNTETSLERVVMLLFNVWLSDPDSYQTLVAELGGEAALTAMIMATYPGVMSIERGKGKDESGKDVDRVLTRFWAHEPVTGLDEDAGVHDKTVYLAEVTRRAFPMVDRVAAMGFFGTGQQYKLGGYSPAHKDMPVENVSLLESVEKVRIWMRAITQRFSFTTWYAYLQQQDSIRAKYIESLNLVAGLVQSFGGTQSRLKDYKSRARRLAAHHSMAGAESDNLLWPPDSEGKDFLAALGIERYGGSDEAIHDQLTQGRYYHRADKEDDVDSPFRQYTTMVDNFIRWLCEYVIAGNSRVCYPSKAT